MGGPAGDRNGKWAGGVTNTDKGYRRIKHGRYRDMYEHRAVMLTMLENPISLMFTPGQDIPDGMAVHHQDHNRQNNHPVNLMLLQKCIHDALSLFYRKHLETHWDEYMDWIQKQQEDEVPF